MDKMARLHGDKMEGRLDKRAVDMDMDVAWCLTCSKRTRDPRSPYCSDECRNQDTQPSSSALTGNASPTITAHVPSRLQSPCKASSRGPKSTSRPRSPSTGAIYTRQPSRPPLTTLPSPTQRPLDATQGDKSTQTTLRPRDRRAFSFPSPPSAPRERQGRPSQAMLPPFIRKPNPVSGGTKSPSVAPSPKNTKERGKLGVKSPTTKSRVTTGPNTPLCAESVFGSTSESETEPDPQDLTAVSPFPSTAISTDPTSLPLSRDTTTQTSRLDSKPTKSFGREITREETQDTLRLYRRETPTLAHRKSSVSPVAALVASSASSRSREDIISWAQKVSERPNNTSSDSEDEDRGRSRTRRSPRPKGSGKRLPSHNEGEEDETDARAGTTPKSRSSISSALAGLSIGGFGVGPIVKALSTITTPAPIVPPVAPIARRPSVATPSGLGLQAVPSPAEVSKVAVVTTSVAPTPSKTIYRPPPSSSATYPTDSDAPPHFGGATPTLSTISISEVMDPSMSDAHDHVEVVTDLEDAMSTASYARRAPSSSSRLRMASAQSPPTKPGRKAPLPLRPVVSTANAIWNFSSYLRSITPFSIASAIAPYGPFSPNTETPPTVPTKLPPQPVLSKSGALAVDALATSRVASPDLAETSPVQMVRSLPMDIAMPLNAGAKQANQERMIEREAKRWLGRSGSRRRTRSRSRDRSRSVTRSHSRTRRSSEHSLGMSDHEMPGGEKRYTSYDADESGAEDAPRRGRSRRGKVLGRDEVRA